MLKDTYFELTIYTKESLVDFIADFVMNFTNEAVEVGKNTIILRTTKDTSALENALKEFECKIEKEEKENIDWIKAYQDSVTPIEAGKFWVYPSWHKPKEDKINIIINPALAFGSGHHATTYSCLQAISKYVTKGKSFLDVGCGSGILALAAKKLGAIVDLCDTDPLAIESSKENFALNQENYNKIWVGSINKTNKKYDIIVANIIADVLVAISSELKAKFKEVLILSGILNTKEAKVQKAFEDLKLIERICKDEWVTLIFQKI